MRHFLVALLLTLLALPARSASWPYFPPPGGPLQAANLMAGVISAYAVASSNITLSGVQTVDGVSVGTGQTVLVIAQTSAVQNGIYISASGAWTRAANFPAGYAIPTNCDLNVFVEHGTINTATTYRLVTAGTVIIGTSAQSWEVLVRKATSAVIGSVTITAAPNIPAVGLVNGIGPAPPIPLGDCTSFTDANGSIGDNGNNLTATGPCAVTDVTGHPVFQGNGTAPAVTGAGCSLVAGSFDNTGSITATGIDTCTLSFGSAFTTAPHCAIGNIGATVVANLTGQPTTAHAIFLTTAAGTFNYVCL